MSNAVRLCDKALDRGIFEFKSVRAHPLRVENPASPSEQPLRVEECAQRLLNSNIPQSKRVASTNSISYMSAEKLTCHKLRCELIY